MPGAAETDPPFEYLGGDPALDLVNTADWSASGPFRERLGSYERLLRWAEGSGTLPAAEGRRLRRVARQRPAAASASLERARALRAVLRRVFGAVAAGERDAAAWRELDGALAAALAHLRLAPGADPRGGGGAAARWSWREGSEPLDAPLWPVVWSAARLLASEEAASVKVCAGPDCGWTYVDRSRNGLRRWCDMRTCGTAEKTRRRRVRG